MCCHHPQRRGAASCRRARIHEAGASGLVTRSRRGSAHSAEIIRYAIGPAADDAALNRLFVRAWPRHEQRDFAQQLVCSPVYVCTYSSERLVGFVNVASDGGAHAFLLDPTVDPDFQRQGIGRALIRRAAEASRSRGAQWLHVDYGSHLGQFHQIAGFRTTSAGVMNLATVG